MLLHHPPTPRAVSAGPVLLATCAATLLAVAALAAAPQTPAPFPRPSQQAPPQRQLPPTTAPAPARPAAAAATGEPSEATLGAPIYPGAQFIASYDAGSGQRYYLFGTESDFAQIVGYYKTILKQKGDPVFDAPPIHMFELGKYKEETMAFTPSVTVKDYAFGGAQGYINPKHGGTPARFKTIIQIVPAPPAGVK